MALTFDTLDRPALTTRLGNAVLRAQSHIAAAFAGPRGWHCHDVGLADVASHDGEALTGLVMRRRLGDVWEYRRASEAEIADHLAGTEW